MRFMWMKKNHPCNRQPGYYTMRIVQKIDDDDDDELYEISFFFHTINSTVKIR